MLLPEPLVKILKCDASVNCILFYCANANLFIVYSIRGAKSEVMIEAGEYTCMNVHVINAHAKKCTYLLVFIWILFLI